MNIEYSPKLYSWVLIPFTSSIFVGLAGCWGVRHVLNKPPLDVLKRL